MISFALGFAAAAVVFTFYPPAVVVANSLVRKAYGKVLDIVLGPVPPEKGP